MQQYNIFEIIFLAIIIILSLIFWIGILSILLYKIVNIIWKTPDRKDFQFFVRYLVYIVIFTVYDAVVILFTLFFVFNPAAPSVLYFINKTFFDTLIQNIPAISNLLNTLSNHPQSTLISNILFINFVLLGWVLIVISPFKLENPLDFNNPNKTNFLTKFLDKLLNLILQIRVEIDLKKYLIETNLNLKKELRLDSEFEQRLAKYEDWRFAEYEKMIRKPLSRRLFLEIVIGSGLLASGVIGFGMYTPNISGVDDFFIMLFLFGMATLLLTHYAKRVNLNSSIKFKSPTEHLTKKYLPIVQTTFKKDILDYVFNKSSKIYIAGGVKSTGRYEELSVDSFLNLDKRRFEVNDFLEVDYKDLEIKFYELKTSFTGSQSHEQQLQNSGIYVKTNFEEQFEGTVFVTTRNKSFLAKQYINYPDLAQGLEFETESLDFNKQFFVHTTNQIEARLALKTNIMYALLQLSNLNRNIYLKLEKNSSSLFIETTKDFFEYDYFAKQKLNINFTINQLKNEIYNQYQLPILISLLLNPRTKNSKI